MDLAAEAVAGPEAVLVVHRVAVHLVDHLVVRLDHHPALPALFLGRRREGLRPVVFVQMRSSKLQERIRNIE